MKKFVCAALAAVVGFSAFAGEREGKGNIAFTLDTRAAWDSESGFNVKRGEDDYYLEFLCNYETDIGGAMFRLRNNLDAETPQLNMDRWGGWIKPCKYFKVYMGNEPVELYTESVRYDAIAGAGIFESAGNHAYVEAYPMDGLTVGAGVLNASGSEEVDHDDDDSTPKINVEHGDPKKPMLTFAAWATYEISCVGNATLTYESLSTGIAWDTGIEPKHWYDTFDGDAKRIGAIFNYNGIDNFNAILGYAGILLKDENDDLKLVQNRFDLDLLYTAEKYSVELFNSSILRDSDVTKGNLGERLGFKGEYYLSDLITPWIRVNYYKNYTSSFDPAWGSTSLVDANGKNAAGDDVSFKDEWAVIVEPRVSFNFGKGFTAIVGFDFKHFSAEHLIVDGNDIAPKQNLWAIPVEFIINF